MAERQLDSSKVLTKQEVNAVTSDLDRKVGWSDTAKLNRVIFHAAVFAGCRVSEICDLRLSDVRIDSSSPALQIRRGKGGKSRVVPLWHSPAVEVLRQWKQRRIEHGAQPTDLLVTTRTGKGLSRQGARKRFLTACRCLGERKLTIHHGRHTFVSLSLAAGVPITAVRDAAGHCSISITNCYAHLMDVVQVRDLLA
jgi:integrase